MAGIWVDSTTAATLHGAYAIERNPPPFILPIGTATAGMFGQFPWGPDVSGRAATAYCPGSLSGLYPPTNFGDIANTFAPPGMSRSGTGWLSIIRKAFPDLRIGRIVGATTPLPGSITLLRTATPHATCTLKYVGAAGNSVTAQAVTASDGVATHWDLIVTITGATGTTTDRIYNLDGYAASSTYSWSGCPLDGSSKPVLDVSAQCRLLGTITLLENEHIPTLNGAAAAFTGGSDGGTVAANDYIGNAGSGDKGFAVAENDPDVRVVFTDDCSDTARVATNAGLSAHCTLMGDRVCFVSGNAGLTSTTVKTAKDAFSGAASFRAVWCDPWVYEYDDNQNLARVPPQSFFASVATQLPPSTSIAWKSDKVINMLQGIIKLETPRGQAAYSNTLDGISTLISEANGGFSIESDVLCGAPTNPAKRRLARTRTGDYIAVSWGRSVRGYVDIPNVQMYQLELRASLDTFLSTMLRNSTRDAAGMAHIVGYTILPDTSFNDDQSLAEGNYILPVDVTTSSGMEHIFLSIRFGENVQTTVKAV